MAGAHETMEQSEHVEHAAGHNKGIALLIAILALFLAFAETLGKSSQTEGITLNIKASDTWNFFQAKTIRQTVLRAAAENLAVEGPSMTEEAAKAAATKQVEAWKNTVARYESDPKEKDGRKELREQAEHFEHERDISMSRYHNYELASAAFQIAIVLASATIITGMVILAWLAGALGIVGVGFMAIGLFAPNLLFLAH
ncbi:MAG: DUF4337 domain-containing protein [Xanthobacteraceae bacterium]